MASPLVALMCNLAPQEKPVPSLQGPWPAIFFSTLACFSFAFGDPPALAPPKRKSFLLHWRQQSSLGTTTAWLRLQPADFTAKTLLLSPRCQLRAPPSPSLPRAPGPAPGSANGK